MESISQPTTVEESSGGSRRGELVAGIVMIGAGLAYVLANFLDRGSLLLPMLAVGFIVAGMLTREAGWFIPGGILGGLSLGIYLQEGPFRFAGEQRDGVFMLAFALGWFSITLLSRLFTRERHWWALIPGGVMTLIGLAALGLGSAARLLQLAGALWPVALIGAGLSILFQRWRQRRA